MSATDDGTLIIEETELDLEERSGPSPWLVLGIIGVILALVFGIRSATKRREAAGEATPTEVGGTMGASAFDTTGGA
jgi:hypothetical protein